MRRSFPGFLVLAAFAAGAAQADTTSLTVTATVRAVASVQAPASPSLVITAADVRRGWIEAPDPVPVAVRTNSLQGSTLVFTGTSEHVQQVTVTGLAAPVQMDTHGGSVRLPAQARANVPTNLLLRFRFQLAPDTPVGVHAWPVNFSAQPA